ncbi:deferrochelatase/peroxidase EfeB [Pseudonocardiaceae bacterium YIM PH 21723]|nr:deferrochelatase/peroxidase EfeB [Pseudonocardiaceae bacterium YIM PH 21723]
MSVSRRSLLGIAGAGAVAGGVGYLAAERQTVPGGVDAPVPFHGRHQAGIVTPAQDRMHFVSLDVTTTKRSELVDLLREWTIAAQRMTEGQEAAPGGAVGGGPYAPPKDTGEALGLPASGLTLTCGLGGSLFDDRFGLADRKPAALADLPAFPKDKLDPARSGGDLCIQACANDPQVAVHAIRNLIRIGFGAVSVRWSQLGFGRTSSTTRGQATPRNLFGFKDGTNNPKAEDVALLDQQVWVNDGSWMTGGSYLVARRIRMHIEIWDRTSLDEQEAIIGRSKGEGAPLGAVAEFDPLDFSSDAIALDAHVRLAHSTQLGGVKILRRGYNFVDGSDGVGHLDAGLFFIGFQRDPHAQFVPMQMALATKDRMFEYIQHTGSALFAIPPGVRPGGYWADTLLD